MDTWCSVNVNLHVFIHILKKECNLIYFLDQSVQKDFNTVFEPFERGSVPLNFSWKTTQQLSNVKGSEGYRDSLARVSAL